MENIQQILDNISQGLYVLTTKDGGCIIDSVSQISMGDNPLIALSVMKRNNTNYLMQTSTKSALSFIGMDTDMNVIKEFGFHSMRDYDKFKYKNVELRDDLPIIKDGLGYVILEKKDQIENNTHTLFICSVITGEKLRDGKPLSYNYFKEHKDELLNK